MAVHSLVPFPSSLGVAPKKSFITVSKLCKASHETPKLCNVRLSAYLPASPSCQSVPRVCLYFYCFHSLSFLQYPGEKKKLYYYFEACGPLSKALEARVICLSLVFLLSVSLLPFVVSLPSLLSCPLLLLRVHRNLKILLLTLRGASHLWRVCSCIVA